MSQPLSGLLVVEFCQYLAGPSAGLRLSDLGARVIKVERPETGEANRRLNVKDMWLDGSSYSFHAFNRGKESVAADLKDPNDLAFVKELLAAADVVTHNFRPGVMEKLGLDYESLVAANPGLIYAEVTGYGREGPWQALPGQDLLVQARSGLAWLTGDADQPPVPFGLAVVDMYAAAHLAQGILAALVRRQQSGVGAHVAVSLLESAIDLQFEVITTHLNDGGRPPKRSRVNNAHAYLGAPYGMYQTADGYIALAMGSITRLAELLECERLQAYAEPREWFDKRDEIKAILADHLRRESTETWLERLSAGDYWASAVLSWDELFQEEAFLAMDMTLDVKRPTTGSSFKTTRCPLRVDGQLLNKAAPSPDVGEHTQRIAADVAANRLAGWPRPDASNEPRMASESLPLAGLTVLDMSQFLSGPSAALRLADLGARVIKIERPQGGDICRSLYISDTDIAGDSTLFHAINRNKESVALDLKDPVDLAVAKDLVRRADVLIENFRPGVADRLGLGCEAARQLNPKLVYASITGYGPSGPWRQRPGQDLLAQAISGLAWLSGDERQGPVPMGLSVVDLFAGAHLVQGILACLARRSRTNQGGRVEASLLESAIDLQFEVLTIYLNDGGQLPMRSSVYNAHAYVGAPYGLFPTADGHLALAMGSIPLLGELLECDELLAYQDPAEWFDKRDEIKATLARHLKQRPTRSWLDRLEPADVWCAEVLDWKNLLQHEGFQALDMLQQVERRGSPPLVTTRCPIRLDGQTLKSKRGAPAIGQDTVAILSEL